MERDPLPDAKAWRSIKDQRERLRVGLAAVYGWYERNADLVGCVLRDAEFHSLTREVADLRLSPFMADYADVLGAGLNARQRAMLQLALGFFTWRSLVRDGGMKSAAAAKVMAQAVDGAGES